MVGDGIVAHIDTAAAMFVDLFGGIDMFYLVITATNAGLVTSSK